MFKFKKKTFVIFIGLSVLTIGFLVLGLLLNSSKTKSALALPDEDWAPLRGWVWTDTVGWLSLNSKNDGGRCINSSGADGGKCDASGGCSSGYTCQRYWVAVDEVTGVVDGYAWSEHVGWVAFRKTGFCANDYRRPCETSSECGVDTCNYVNVTPPDTAYTSRCQGGSCSGNCLACYNQTNKKFYGWGRVLSLASNTGGASDAGWLKLDIIFNSTDYGVKVNGDDVEADNRDAENSLLPKGNSTTTWGDLYGWAWSDGSRDSATGLSYNNGLGWLSFNCTNSSGVCASSNYKVTGRPSTMGSIKVKQQENNESYGLTIDWTNSFPLYGTSYYEVWRKNWLCLPSADPDHCSGGDNRFCQTGTSCQIQDYQRILTNAVTGSYDDNNLQLFVNYEYTVRACNVFGCSRSPVASFRTSPIEHIRNLKAVPICATDNASLTSYVDLSWSKPYIVSFSGAEVAYYEIEYCRLDANQNLSDCAEADWQPASPDCDNPPYNNQNTQSCREILTEANSRYQYRNDFHVYRIRGIGDDGNVNKACVGGDNDTFSCSTDTDCPGGSCQPNPSKSTWSYSDIFRICPADSAYQERRPN